MPNITLHAWGTLGVLWGTGHFGWAHGPLLLLHLLPTPRMAPGQAYQLWERLMTFTSPPFPLCSWQVASPRTLLPFPSSRTIPIQLLEAWYCLFHENGEDLGWLFSSLLLLGLCHCLSLCPDSSIASELDYATRERTLSCEKGLDSLEHRRSFSSFIWGQGNVSQVGSSQPGPWNPGLLWVKLGLLKIRKPGLYCELNKYCFKWDLLIYILWGPSSVWKSSMSELPVAFWLVCVLLSSPLPRPQCHHHFSSPLSPFLVHPDFCVH